MTEKSAARQVLDIVLAKLEEGFPELLEDVQKDIEYIHDRPGRRRGGFLIPDIPGYVTEMYIEVHNYIDYGNPFMVELFCSVSHRQTRVRKEFAIAPELWQAVTEEDNVTVIIPAIKAWWQEKLLQTPYGGAFDYRTWCKVLSYITPTSGDVCQLEEYIADPDPVRQAVWREKLADCIRSEKYREHGDEDAIEKKIRIAEPLLMVDELGFDAVAKYFLHIKEAFDSTYFTLPGFEENISQLCREYRLKQSPTEQETQNFHDILMLALELMERQVVPFYPQAIRALVKNGYPFAAPYLLQTEEALEVLKSSITAWVQEQRAGKTQVRALKVYVKQPRVGPAQISINKMAQEACCNLSLLVTGDWVEAVLDALGGWFTPLVRERQDLFMPRVELKLTIDADRYISHTLDLKLDPEYDAWAGERLRLLEQGRFDQVGYPLKAREVDDIIELLEQTQVAFDYLAALEAYAKANQIDLDEDDLLSALSNYFEREEKEEALGDPRKQDAQSALAQFFLRHGQGYRLERPRNHLKRLYRAGNQSARDFLQDYQEWLDADYWFGEYDPNGVGEKLRKAQPKEGLLYKERTRGTDVVVALTEDSRECYGQALDYLLKAVPRAAKRAEKEEAEHSVTIFFPGKPSFPEVPIYKDTEFSWPELAAWGSMALPRSPELAFFKRALEWEELHPKVVKYADTLLKGEYRINGGEEFCSLAALPVVAALIMHDRAYFPYAGKYAALADDEHEEVQIHLIPGIIRKYGLDEESVNAIASLAGSFQNGYEYVELIPELEAYLSGDEAE